MSVNINDSVPAAPTGSVNVKWQKDTSGNTSGYTTPAESVNAQTGTSYTVVAGDRATLVTFSNASAIAVTMPQATGSFTTGWYSDVRNLGVGSVTITPTTSTINGASALVLATGQSARIVSDGTNYQITNLINNANPMTTAGDIIYGGASGAPTRLAGGTSTYVLTSNGATSAPSWQAAGGGGGTGAFVQLEQQVASSSAELDFTASFTSTYKEYLVEIRDFVPATSGAAPLIQFSTNGGSSYDTSSIYDWGHTNCALGASVAGANGQASVNGIVIFADASRVGPASTATPGLSASLRVFNPLSASNHKIVSGDGVSQYNGNGNYFTFNFGGRYKSTTAANAFRIIMTSGNITAGTVTCYGITG